MLNLKSAVLKKYSLFNVFQKPIMKKLPIFYENYFKMF